MPKTFCCPIDITAVEKEGKQIGRIRMQVIPNCSSASILSFINENVEPKSRIIISWEKVYANHSTSFKFNKNNICSDLAIG